MLRIVEADGMMEDGHLLDQLYTIGADTFWPVCLGGAFERDGDLLDLGWFGKVKRDEATELRGRRIDVDGTASTTSIFAGGRLSAEEDDRLELCDGDAGRRRHFGAALGSYQYLTVGSIASK